MYTAVASHADGRAIATKVNTDTLNRITFFHDITIENARIISGLFSSLTAQPHVVEVSPSAKLYAWTANEVQFTIGIPAEHLKADLEQTSPPGESNFGLFRSARQSMSPVEEFLRLYNILLMFCGDSQFKVDQFIVREEPTVKQTQDPRSRKNNMETVYTRLRNEFGHKRNGVNIDNTKAEMTNHLHGLNTLVKRAIELLT